MERKGVTYVECKRADCPFIHLTVNGRNYAEWTHPLQPRVSGGWLARVQSNTLPPVAHGARAFVR